ncbi:hypothetical protein FVF58_42135 [Paraburkholderia panacisoli]|uniref:Uncharacterized protein n=1 Tax=Paraburkholderia panacisoli TaxID=2603818 RepID=A0A5B0G7F1_9BURK|nr:hypothetical protein FVF58_42135 [Paraburkholderia panacisoli]
MHSCGIVSIPLYWQAKQLRRFGGDISSNTLAARFVRVGLEDGFVIGRKCWPLADTVACVHASANRHSS